MPDGSFYRFRLSPSGDQLSGLLDEGRRLLEIDGHQPVRRRYFLDAEGRQRSFPATANRVETAEEVSVAVVRDLTDQAELPYSADILWVVSDLPTSGAPWSLLWCCNPW